MSTKSGSRVPSFIQQAVDDSSATRFKRPVSVPKDKSLDNFLIFLIAIVVIALAAISAVVWMRAKNANYVQAPQFSFSKAGPYQVESQYYTISATLSVQTGEDDAGWVRENQKTLDTVFKKLLADNVDTGTTKTPAGLQKLQDALAAGSNQVLGSNHVQAVLLTDFKLETRDQPQQ
jgi:flagellar basal body-associated protein FliL